MDRLQYLDIMSVEVVEFSIECLDIMLELSETFDHKLHTIIGKVWILFGVDLYGCKNKNGSDLFVFSKLLDECGVIDYP